MKEKTSYALELFFSLILAVAATIGNYFLLKETEFVALLIYGIIGIGLWAMFFLILSSMSFILLGIDRKENRLKIAGGILYAIILETIPIIMFGTLGNLIRLIAGEVCLLAIAIMALCVLPTEDNICKDYSNFTL